MMIFFPTRSAARDHSRATGFNSKLIDNGKDADKGKRYGCTVNAQPVPASRASAPIQPSVVITRKGHKVAVIVKKHRTVIFN